MLPKFQEHNTKSLHSSSFISSSYLRHSAFYHYSVTCIAQSIKHRRSQKTLHLILHQPSFPLHPLKRPQTTLELTANCELRRATVTTLCNGKSDMVAPKAAADLGWAKEKLRRGWDRDEADEGIELVRNAARGGGDCVLKTAADLDVERNDLEMEPRREAIPAVCL